MSDKIRDLLGLLLVLFNAFTSIAAAQSGTVQEQATAELERLVTSAKKDGELTLYAGSPDSTTRRTNDAFTAKYGVKVAYVRLASVQLLQRYSSEAEVGNIAADVMLTNPPEAYVTEAIRKGWMEPLSAARIPVLMSGEYPARFNRGAVATVGVQPWLILYNTNRVKGADVPRDWADLLEPKWKGQLILTDPRASDAYLPLWSMILDRHGEAYFTRLRAQVLRISAGGIPAAQALAAGEGVINFPNIGNTIQALLDKGAPLATSIPAYTTGSQPELALTHRNRARHANAARLYVNYVLSSEGNKVFNADPGSLSVYDTTNLSREYAAPKATEALARKDLIVRLLGL